MSVALASLPAMPPKAAMTLDRRFRCRLSRQAGRDARPTAQILVHPIALVQLPQGNRISDLSDEVGEEGVAPAGSFDFSAI